MDLSVVQVLPPDLTRLSRLQEVCHLAGIEFRSVLSQNVL